MASWGSESPLLQEVFKTRLLINNKAIPKNPRFMGRVIKTDIALFLISNNTK